LDANISRCKVEYDRLVGCEIPARSWNMAANYFYKYPLDRNDYNHLTYIEFDTTSEYILEDEIISARHISADSLQIHAKSIRDEYKNAGRLRWRVYVCAMDSLRKDETVYGVKVFGYTYWPHSYGEQDTSNTAAFVFVKRIYEFASNLDSVPPDSIIKEFIGMVLTVELGRAIAYLKSYWEDPAEHIVDPSGYCYCIMNEAQSAIMLEWWYWMWHPDLLYFCEKCIYHFRGNPRKRGPIVLKGATQ